MRTKIKDRVNLNYSVLSNRFILKSSERDYFRGLFMSFILMILTLGTFWITNVIYLKINIGGEAATNIVGYMVDIGSVLGVGQVLLYLVFSIFTWAINYWREWNGQR